MADKAFGVKDINLIGASGTPTIESPNNLNINAVNVAISTDITVAGKVSLGAGTSISSPAANKLTFGTSSQERVSINSGGLVAIGKTDPSLYHPATNALVVARGNTNDGITIDCSNQAGIFFSNGSNSSSDINGQLIYYHTPDDESMRFLIQGEKLRIKENGDVNVSAGGSVFIGNGNLVFSTSGTGIDFSATSDGGTGTPSELFDDYEEGSWTPSITLGGGSTGMTYSRQEGHYTKIGRQVFAQFRITLTAKGSSTGQLRINGLPFTAADVFTSTGIDGQVHIAHDNGFTAAQVSNNSVAGYVEGGTTYFLLTTRDTNANLNTMTNAFIASDLSISGTVIFYA